MERDAVLDEEIIKKVKELSSKYGKNEKYVLLLFKICLDLKCKHITNIIEDYISSVSKSVSKNKT